MLAEHVVTSDAEDCRPTEARRRAVQRGGDGDARVGPLNTDTN
jgi:hypothetical protein